MNKYKFFISAFCLLMLVVGCEKDKVTPVQPSSISNIQTEALPGEIKITWTKNEPVEFEYIKVTYFDKLEKKEMLRLASKYSDGITIPGTRAKYGDYSFTLQPFSITDTGGDVMTVQGKSGPAPATFNVIGPKPEPVKLTVDGLFADAPEPSEGPIADLIDGNKNSFFHAAWSVDYGPMPHYIVVKLPEKLQAFKFNYITRNHGGAGNHPKLMNVYASNGFDGKTYDVSGILNVAELKDLPNGASKEYESGNYVMDQKYEYIWFEVKQTHGNTPFFALAELSITELELEIIDPEAPAEGD